MKPPAQIPGDVQAPQFDNLQLILQRRAELAKNKSKYTLTENDGKLIGTHSTELKFEDGQVLFKEGQDVSNVYRIRSGKVIVSRFGYQFNVIDRGWLIGDGLLVLDQPIMTVFVTMQAKGPVVLEQLNLPFIKQLFSIDTVLRAKFMKHLLTKYSFLFTNVITDLNNPFLTDMRKKAGASTPNSQPLLSSVMGEDLSDSSSSMSDDSDGATSDGVSHSPAFTSASSSSSLSSNSSGSSTPSTPKTEAKKLVMEESVRARRASKEVKNKDHVYKTYPLSAKGHNVQNLQLTSDKIKILSKTFGFHLKTKIEFTKIITLTKVGDTAATIVYQPRKVANVFFKNYHDREEFFGLMNSLTSHQAAAAQSPGQHLSVPHDPSVVFEEVSLCPEAKAGECRSIETPLSLKKGDKLVEEGDLFQRVYTLVKGTCNIVQNGRIKCHMKEGDVFGIASLMYLRPCPVTLEVSSDTAEVVYVPAYKINALIDTDTTRAADMYNFACKMLMRQMNCAVRQLPEVPHELSESKLMALEREKSESSVSDELPPQQVDATA